MRPRSKSSIAGGNAAAIEGFVAIYDSLGKTTREEEEENSALQKVISVKDFNRLSLRGIPQQADDDELGPESSLNLTASISNLNTKEEFKFNGIFNVDASGQENGQEDGALVAGNYLSTELPQEMLRVCPSISGITAQLISGVNVFVVGFSEKDSNASKLLWGLESLETGYKKRNATAEEEGGGTTTAGFLGTIGANVIEQITKHCAANQDHTFELKLSLFATEGNKVLDLQAPVVGGDGEQGRGEGTAAATTTNLIQVNNGETQCIKTTSITKITYVDGVASVIVPASAETFQQTVVQAFSHLSASEEKRPAITPSGLVAILEISQTIVGESDSGEKLSTVRAASLVIVQAPELPETTLSPQEALSHPMQSLSKYLDAVFVAQRSKRPGGRVLPTPTDDDVITHLVAPGFGQTNACIVLGSLTNKPYKELEDTAAGAGDTDSLEDNSRGRRSSASFSGPPPAIGSFAVGGSRSVLQLITKCKAVKNSIKANGGVVDNVVADMQAEITRLKRMLDSGHVASQNTQKKLEDELKEKQDSMEALRSTTEKALQQYDQLSETFAETHYEMLKLSKEKEDLEEKQVKAEFELSHQKQKAFAQAFKNAFLKDKYQENLTVVDKSAKEDLERAQGRVKELDQIVVANGQEKDRLTYRISSLERDLKNSKKETGTLELRLENAHKDLHDSQDRAEELATKLNLSKFESTNETHDLRRELAQLERKCDHQGFELEALREENTKLKDELESRVLEETGSIRNQLMAAREDQRLTALDSRSRQQVISDMEQEKQELMLRIESLESEISALKDDHHEQSSSHESGRMKLVDRIGKLKEQHSIEREGYHSLLGEGKEMMEELRKIENCIIERPSLVKSGWPGVVAWLKAHNLQQYQSSFQQSGFTDMFSVIQVTEEDLMEMKLLRGSRRKVLAAAELARRDLGMPDLRSGSAERAESNNKAASASPSPAAPSAGGGEDKPSYAKTTSARATREADEQREREKKQKAGAGSNSISTSQILGLDDSGQDPDAEPTHNEEVRDLLSDLASWMKDFSASIRAEAEASSEL